MQHGLIGVARPTQCNHVGSRDCGWRACELAGILQQRPQLWRQQVMVTMNHCIDQRRIILDQTERRPVMFDSVMALVGARNLYCDGFALGARKRRRAEHQCAV
jgi:hypothetical protein